jgi:hypothetical protein
LPPRSAKRASTEVWINTSRWWRLLIELSTDLALSFHLGSEPKKPRDYLTTRARSRGRQSSKMPYCGDVWSELLGLPVATTPSTRAEQHRRTRSGRARLVAGT